MDFRQENQPCRRWTNSKQHARASSGIVTAERQKAADTSCQPPLLFHSKYCSVGHHTVKHAAKAACFIGSLFHVLPLSLVIASLLEGASEKVQPPIQRRATLILLVRR